MNKTKKLTTTALLCALAYIATFFIRIPISSVEFLKYDPKDVIVVIGGFIFGPLTAVVISVVVSLIEMVTISTTGIIGAIMNAVSTMSFAVIASSIYKSKKKISGAVTGLLAGMISVTAVMLIWNYFLTPIYQGIPRSAIAAMLVPVFLPFNLIKSGLNTAITLLLYKPFVTTLRRTGLIQGEEKSGKMALNTGVLLSAVFIALMCVLAIYIIKH